MTTVLYIEDNFENRILVRRVLQAEGYEVAEATSASEALNILKDLKPDLILTDINMPEMDGYTLTAKIKEMPDFQHTPVVAMTANVMRGDKERSLKAGCDGYIQKPIDIDLLAGQVERFIKKAGAK